MDVSGGDANNASPASISQVSPLPPPTNDETSPAIPNQLGTSNQNFSPFSLSSPAPAVTQFAGGSPPDDVNFRNIMRTSLMDNSAAAAAGGGGGGASSLPVSPPTSAAAATHREKAYVQDIGGLQAAYDGLKRAQGGLLGELEYVKRQYQRLLGRGAVAQIINESLPGQMRAGYNCFQKWIEFRLYRKRLQAQQNNSNQITAASDQSSSSSDSNHVMATENRRLQERLARLKPQLEGLEESLRQTTTERDGLLDELRGAQTEMDQLHRQLAELEVMLQEKNVSEGRRVEVDADLRQRQSQRIQQTQEANEGLKRDVSDLQEENALLRQCAVKILRKNIQNKHGNGNNNSDSNNNNENVWGRGSHTNYDSERIQQEAAVEEEEVHVLLNKMLLAMSIKQQHTKAPHASDRNRTRFVSQLSNDTTFPAQLSSVFSQGRLSAADATGLLGIVGDDANNKPQNFSSNSRGFIGDDTRYSLLQSRGAAGIDRASRGSAGAPGESDGNHNNNVTSTTSIQPTYNTNSILKTLSTVAPSVHGGAGQSGVTTNSSLATLPLSSRLPAAGRSRNIGSNNNSQQHSRHQQNQTVASSLSMLTKHDYANNTRSQLTMEGGGAAGISSANHREGVASMPRRRPTVMELEAQRVITQTRLLVAQQQQEQAQQPPGSTGDRGTTAGNNRDRLDFYQEFDTQNTSLYGGGGATNQLGGGGVVGTRTPSNTSHTSLMTNHTKASASNRYGQLFQGLRDVDDLGL